MCFWHCGKWKQNAAHSEKFIYLTGQLQIHPSPAWHQWKNKPRIWGIGGYFNSEQKLGLRSGTLWIQHLCRTFLSSSFPGSSRDGAAGAGPFVPFSRPFLAGFYLDSASPAPPKGLLDWHCQDQSFSFQTLGMNSSAPSPWSSAWGAAPCCFNGLKQSLEFALLPSKPWNPGVFHHWRFSNP